VAQPHQTGTLALLHMVPGVVLHTTVHHLCHHTGKRKGHNTIQSKHRLCKHGCGSITVKISAQGSSGKNTHTVRIRRNSYPVSFITPQGQTQLAQFCAVIVYEPVAGPMVVQLPLGITETQARMPEAVNPRQRRSMPSPMKYAHTATDFNSSVTAS